VVAGGTTNYAANDLNQYNYVGSVYYDYDLNGNTTPFGQENGKMGTVVMLKKPSNKCSKRASLSAVAYPF
jgi:hypothetical protein